MEYMNTQKIGLNYGYYIKYMIIPTKLITSLFLLTLVKCQDLARAEKWLYGLLTGVCLSLIGFIAAIILVSFRRCFSEACFKIFVNLLYALACGAILGESVIQILPQAFKSESTNQNYVSLVFICAILFFIILDRVFKAFGIAHQHFQEGEHHLTSNHQESSLIDGDLLSKNSIKRKGQKSCLQNLKGKGAAGYLNLLSSLLHNFFDGLGIGIGFATGDRNTIIPIVFAIFAHEIPREMGDVGIMIKNGFSNVQTVLCNGFINFLSLLGVLAGLAFGNISEDAQRYVLVFVGGNFIYIGAEIWKHLLVNKRMILNIGELLMFCLGVGAIFLVLLTQSQKAKNTS